MQVDIFSDYASVRSSSGKGSDVSRSSSVAGETDAGVISTLMPQLGNGGKSSDSGAPLPYAVGKQSSPSHSPAALVPGHSASGEHHLNGSLQRYLLVISSLSCRWHTFLAVLSCNLRQILPS
jgi:hypothetical protein